MQPNILFAQSAGLETGRGIKVTATMQTADADIYAVGDVAEPDGQPMTGLWLSAAAQAEGAIASTLGEERAFASKPNMLRLKSDGIDVFSFSDIKSQSDEEIWTSPPQSESYWMVTLRNGSPAAGVFAGPPGSGKSSSRLLQEKTAQDAVRVLQTAGTRAAGPFASTS